MYHMLVLLVRMGETYQMLTLDCPSKLPTHDPPKFYVRQHHQYVSKNTCYGTHGQVPKQVWNVYMAMLIPMPIYLSIYV